MTLSTIQYTSKEKKLIVVIWNSPLVILAKVKKNSEIKPPSINLLAMFDLPPSPQIKPSYAGKEQLL